ncbi:MAG TPA: YaiO family outer membrane beta-barrel protein [Fibrobacteria bacterium]|mgnify:CR=1 FL=1|nr:YaiO family outer membrane beta-barrel protein [Fibrobacteria bacterium]HOX50050.1 YaiO family outer membrane beta-barrel protein [Fibrobacteria bacterium]
MTSPLWAVLLCLAPGTDGVRLELSTAVARLDFPQDAPLWSEIGAGIGWRMRDRWATLSANGVRRWDLDDRQAEVRLGFSPVESLAWEGQASLGQQERFLPTWSAGTALSKTFAGGWVGTLGGKVSDYRGWQVVLARGLVERYIRSFRLGAGMAGSGASGADPGMDWRILAGWDWSDVGGIALDLSHARELERLDEGIVERISNSATLSARQGIGSRLTVRPALSWTRLEGIHDRWEARLGVECGLGS